MAKLGLNIIDWEPGGSEHSRRGSLEGGTDTGGPFNITDKPPEAVKTGDATEEEVLRVLRLLDGGR